MAKANIKAIAIFKTRSKQLEKLFNGIENGIRTKIIGTKTELRKQLKDHFKPIADELVQTAKRFDVDSSDHDTSSLELIMKQATPVVSHIIRAALDGQTAEKEEKIDNSKDVAVKNALRSYRKKSEDLPKSLNNQLFTIVKLPVVPYINFSLLSNRVLRSSGIEFTSMDDGAYTVFEDQVLLAFDFKFATTNDNGKRKGADSATFKQVKVPVMGKNNKPLVDADGKIVMQTQRVANRNSLKARRLAEQHTKMQEDFVLNVLDRINERSPEKFTLMSNHFEFNPINSNIAFAWLVPKQIHRSFNNAGNLQDAKWGFPWSKMKPSTM